MLDFIRGCVRPFISLLFSTAIVIVAIRLLMEFANLNMAQMVLGFLLGEGSAIINFHYGERSQKTKG